MACHLEQRIFSALLKMLRAFAGKAGVLRTTSRCIPMSMLARLGWLAQFSQTLVIAPSALGSAHRLTAKRRTPFSPRAHYKLGI